MHIENTKELYGVTERKLEIPQDLIRVVNENFVLPYSENQNESAVQFIKKYPVLLNFDYITLKNKFKEFSKYGWTKRQITKAFIRNKSLFGLNSYDLQDKVMVFKDLGFSSTQLIENPLLLSCPSKDIKLKFMLGKFVGFNVYNVSFFIQSVQKTFARICFIEEIDESFLDSLLLTEKEFFAKFKITDAELKQNYPLTEKAVANLQDNYLAMQQNSTNLPYVELTEDEQQKCVSRITIKELKKQFNAENKAEALRRKQEKWNAITEEQRKKYRQKNALVNKKDNELEI